MLPCPFCLAFWAPWAVIAVDANYDLSAAKAVVIVGHLSSICDNSCKPIKNVPEEHARKNHLICKAGKQETFHPKTVLGCIGKIHADPKPDSYPS